jgi:hypothetical protein
MLRENEKYKVLRTTKGRKIIEDKNKSNGSE